MSVWRITAYEPLISREWTLSAVLPEVKPNEARPIPALILLNARGCEADAILRRLPLERTLCAEKGMAALCLPGWATECPEVNALIGSVAPAWFERMFPVRVTGLYGDAEAADWLESAKRRGVFSYPLLQSIQEEK